MKKFIAGFIAGALIFCAVPAFADSIQNLLGAKVTGVYTIQTQHGEKLAEGAVLNGSAYVPVRAISEATGAALVVDSKKKVITLGDSQGTTQSTEVNSQTGETNSKEGVNEAMKKGFLESIAKNEDRLKMLEEKITQAKSELQNQSGEQADSTKAYIELLNGKVTETKAAIEETKAKLGQ